MTNYPSTLFFLVLFSTHLNTAMNFHDNDITINVFYRDGEDALLDEDRDDEDYLNDEEEHFPSELYTDDDSSDSDSDSDSDGESDDE